MTTSQRPTEAEQDGVEEADESPDTPALNARHVDDERTVFTEEGNSDGWISTDYTVAPSE